MLNESRRFVSLVARDGPMFLMLTALIFFFAGSRRAKEGTMATREIREMAKKKSATKDVVSANHIEVS
jgi:hypothetical protein